MAQGMLGITPQLEAAGRKGDTEVGRISKGSIVLPIVITQDEGGQELMDAMQELYDALQIDYNSFSVTSENTEYATDNDPIEAHLTIGEFIIPPVVLNTAPELKDALKTLFDGLGVNINQYTVGHKDNAINPETGLPEFGWLSKAWKSVTNTVKKVVEPVVDVVKTVVKSITDLGSDFVNGLKGGIPGIVDFVDKAVQNPLVQTAVSILNPLAGAAVSAYAKVDNGGKLTAADIASLGLTAASQLSSFKLSADATKAINVGSKLASGEDPVKALASAYGGDFAKTLGLDKTVNTALTNTFGDKAANFVANNIDVNKAAADLVSGKSAQDIVTNQFGTDLVTYAGDKALAGIGTAFGADTESFLRDRMDLTVAANDIINGVDPAKIVANQFGDDIANYLGGDNESMRALGYAGIDSAVALAGGADTNEALMAGAKTYYNQGGGLPDLGQLAGLTGLDTSGFDWNKYAIDLNIPGSDLLAQGYDWLKNQNINLGNLDFLKGYNAPDLGIDFGQFADLGGNFGDLNWKGVDFRSLGMSLPEAQDLGINLGDLNIGDIPLPAFMLASTQETPQALDQIYIDPFADTTQEEDTTLDALPLSQALLKSTPIV